jgi:hypothetical protein
MNSYEAIGVRSVEVVGAALVEVDVVGGRTQMERLPLRFWKTREHLVKDVEVALAFADLRHAGLFEKVPEHVKEKKLYERLQIAN